MSGTLSGLPGRSPAQLLIGVYLANSGSNLQAA